MSFRNPKYIERYEDVVFDLETALNTTIVNPLTPRFPPRKRFFRVQMPFYGHCLAKWRLNSQ